MRRAVFPGSFDPVTKGHIDLIQRSASLFDEVVVAVLVNSAKQPMFSLEQRMDMLRRSTEVFENVSVAFFDGLLADFVNRIQADVIVRGLRSSVDFEYELPLAQANYRLNTKADTIFLATAPEFSYVSSGAVRELLRYHADVSSYVPEQVYETIAMQ